VNRADALALAVARLEDATVDTPALDAKRLLLHAEQIESASLMASPDAQMRAQSAYDSMIMRRCTGEPVSKILGYRDFWTHRFITSPDVLDPRPDTETLIEAALELFPRTAPLRILDLGTGSGCILLTLLSEFANSTGIGVDVSQAALAVAERNAQAMKLTHRADFIEADWFTGLDETFDLVVSNPPYISTTEKDTLAPEVADWDPEAALFAGMDGLQAYREITSGVSAALKPDGTVLFEIGIGQARPVVSLLEGAGFWRISSRRDLGGIERCIVAQR
jgi:release factor glutamine methyltransferase